MYHLVWADQGKIRAITKVYLSKLGYCYINVPWKTFTYIHSQLGNFA